MAGSQTAESSKNTEPSMDEILASIRQIVSDDKETAAPEAIVVPSEVKPAETSDEAASERSKTEDNATAEQGKTEPETAKQSSAAQENPKATAETRDDLSVSDIEAMMETMEEPLDLTEDFEVAEDELELVDSDIIEFSLDDENEHIDPERQSRIEATGKEIRGRLSQALNADNTMPEQLPPDKPLLDEQTESSISSSFSHLSDMIVGSKARTLEELVQDMLRPMLKQWLDKNLPPLVDDMVKREIERITRRRSD